MRSGRVCILRLPTVANLKGPGSEQTHEGQSGPRLPALGRIVEEMQRRKGTATAQHLKFVLSVIDGPRFAKR